MSISEFPEKPAFEGGFAQIIGHVRALKTLQSMLQKDEIPHALLFSGEEGIGKRTVALTFAQALLCQERRQSEGEAGEGETEGSIEPCGHCLSCRKLTDRNHPDLLTIEPEGSAIKVEQIRALQDRIVFKPVEGSRRIVLIDPADEMNIAAANAFLKTLEEPPSQTILILITSKPFSLPETIRSRCQKVSFHSLSLSQVENLLAERKGWSTHDARLVASLTGGNLGKALSLDIEAARAEETGLHTLVSEKTLTDYEALFEAATSSSRDEETMAKSLHYLSAWFRDVLVLLAVPDPDRLDPSWLVYHWRHEEIKQWARRMDTNNVGKFLADIQEIERAQIRNINRQLALETLLMQLRDKLIHQERMA